MAKELDVLDSQQAAAQLGVSVRRVQQLIASGRLPATRFGMGYLIQRADLAMVAERKPGRPWPKKSPPAPTGPRRRKDRP